jgi:hypothetical protein
MSDKHVMRMVHFDFNEQTESDAFILRIAACKDAEEVSRVVAGVRALHAPAPTEAAKEHENGEAFRN